MFSSPSLLPSGEVVVGCVDGAVYIIDPRGREVCYLTNTQEKSLMNNDCIPVVTCDILAVFHVTCDILAVFHVTCDLLTAFCVTGDVLTVQNANILM